MPLEIADAACQRDRVDGLLATFKLAIEPVDGRKGIDSLARLCQDQLTEDPFLDACSCSQPKRDLDPPAYL